jgi:murein DD-endopeptidase MepM/ murein hydrolase activator NlpD
MWNPDPARDGLWVMRTDGSGHRKLPVLGSYRWTATNRLIVIPMRAAAGESHEVWEANPASGELRRLTNGAETPLRIANYDWDVSPDGTNLVFVDAATRRLTNLSLPAGLQPVAGEAPPAVPAPGSAGGGKPYRVPYHTAPGPSGWYVAQWYGVTTGGYRGRNGAYSQGQGIHFGIDFPAPLGTPVVAVGPGRVLAVDGDYGSPPHNVVLQLADGNQAMYGHLVERSRHVQVGQAVEAGQVVGRTGDSSGPNDGFGNPHLHLEIRKRGRAVATNPVPLFDANWDDLSLGIYPGPRFQRDLDNPRRHQFLDEQPDIWFGGPIITNFARPWPV